MVLRRGYAQYVLERYGPQVGLLSLDCDLRNMSQIGLRNCGWTDEAGGRGCMGTNLALYFILADEYVPACSCAQLLYLPCCLWRDCNTAILEPSNLALTHGS